MWSNAASTSPPLLVLFMEFFLECDSRALVLGGVGLRVSAGACDIDLRPLLVLEILMDLVTDVRASPAVDAEWGLVNVLALPEE